MHCLLSFTRQVSSCINLSCIDNYNFIPSRHRVYTSRCIHPWVRVQAEFNFHTAVCSLPACMHNMQLQLLQTPLAAGHRPPIVTRIPAGRHTYILRSYTRILLGLPSQVVQTLYYTPPIDTSAAAT